LGYDTAWWLGECEYVPWVKVIRIVVTIAPTSCPRCNGLLRPRDFDNDTPLVNTIIGAKHISNTCKKTPIEKAVMWVQEYGI
jgi:hypothetical protein